LNFRETLSGATPDELDSLLADELGAANRARATRDFARSSTKPRHGDRGGRGDRGR